MNFNRGALLSTTCVCTVQAERSCFSLLVTFLTNSLNSGFPPLLFSSSVNFLGSIIFLAFARLFWASSETLALHFHGFLPLVLCAGARETTKPPQMCCGGVLSCTFRGVPASSLGTRLGLSQGRSNAHKMPTLQGFKLSFVCSVTVRM